MATTDLVFNGLTYAVGMTMTAVIGGLDCGDYVVATGGLLTVPISALPTITGFTTPQDYLYSLDVGPWNTTTYGDATTELTLSIPNLGEATIYIPVTIGFTYASIGFPLRPATEAQIKSPQGGGTAKKRKVHQYGFLVAGTQGLQVGTQIMRPHVFRDDADNILPPNILFTGAIYGALDDNTGFDGMLGWQITRPYPANINSINSFLDIEER